MFRFETNDFIQNFQSQSNGLPQLPLREDADVEDTKFPSLQIQWFNAFLNRILFDMFRSPYWLAKIHEKVYKKLNSIRVSTAVVYDGTFCFVYPCEMHRVMSRFSCLTT